MKTMDPVFLAGLVFFGLGVAFVLVNKLRTHAWYERRFSERTPILHEQLVSKLHPGISDPKAAVLIYDAVCECLKVPHGKILPTDRFHEELRPPFPFTHIAIMNGAVSQAVRKLTTVYPRIDFESGPKIEIETVGDLVRALVSSIENGRAKK